MNKKNILAMSLIELIVAMALLSVIVLAFSNIQLFSHVQLWNADIQSRLQNDVNLVLDHMHKNISKAIGSRAVLPSTAVIDTTAISGDPAIKVKVDSGTGVPAAGHWIAYRYRTGATASRYEIWYYWDTAGTGEHHETLAKNISFFNVATGDNYVAVRIAARPSAGSAVSQDNPEVELSTTINLPMVSLK